ncbi:hypothetical protein FOCC_FOCC009006 [Frankliniella occidentalis]|nr:hypothetical protein FOCC_FOCC009006 [Frankliniella occidentalis]
MVLYKGSCAGSLRQFVRNKPHKWGYKFFMTTDIDSLVYDFIPYSGHDTFDNEDLTDWERGLGVGAQTVIALCKRVQKPADTVVAFDNYFSSVPLLTHLKMNMNIEAVGTIRQNRISGLSCLIKT